MSSSAAETIDTGRRDFLRQAAGVTAATVIPTTSISQTSVEEFRNLQQVEEFISKNGFTLDLQTPAKNTIATKVSAIAKATGKKPFVMVTFGYAACASSACPTLFMETSQIISEAQKKGIPVLHINVDSSAQNPDGLNTLINAQGAAHLNKDMIAQRNLVITPPFNDYMKAKELQNKLGYKVPGATQGEITDRHTKYITIFKPDGQLADRVASQKGKDTLDNVFKAFEGKQVTRL